MAGRKKSEREKELEKALKFYSRAENYAKDDGVAGRRSYGIRANAPPSSSAVEADGGTVAREALKEQ